MLSGVRSWVLKQQHAWALWCLITGTKQPGKSQWQAALSQAGEGHAAQGIGITL